jgi:hypothetical protein
MHARNPAIGACRHRLVDHLKYLSTLSLNDPQIPAFYGLIKVHKKPVTIRPIVACHSWLTTPLSRVCAYELHSLVKSHLSHVLADSRQLITMIERIKIPTHYTVGSVRLITGDVEGLYVNIPIHDAITAVTHFCELHRGAAFAAMINSWLSFVFEEALVKFGEHYFRQIWGFPMGTALSPDAANVFMAVQEDVLGIMDIPLLYSCYLLRIVN